MNCQTFQILEAAEVQRVARALSSATFIDGRLTAHGEARKVKNNLQSERRGPEPSDLDRTILAALSRCTAFQAFALPKRMILPTFSKYEPGMRYGTHVDNAIMGDPSGQPVRTDLAMTLFLSEPDSYDGGELVIEMPLGEQEIKLPAGEAIVYPADTLHRVNPITRGVRLAAVTWMQSTVADDRIRTILYDLSLSIDELEDRSSTKNRLLKSYQNLLRIYAEI